MQLTQAHTIWLDNFSKLRALQIPDLDIGSWENCNWTGRAFRVSRVHVDTKVRLTADNVVEPAMPHDIWSLYPAMKAQFLHTTYNEADCPFLYDSCLTTQFKVNNVPLKPDHTRLAMPEHKKAVQEGHDSLANCYPDGIIKINIGSNKGLLRLLRMHYDDSVIYTNGSHYSSLNVDANIFDRTIKVQNNTFIFFVAPSNNNIHTFITSFFFVAQQKQTTTCTRPIFFFFLFHQTTMFTRSSRKKKEHVNIIV
jgi:hypothetical protein